MSKEDKILTGLVIGGIVGVGLFLATRRKEAPLSSLGEAIVHIGEILADHGIEEPSAMKNVEKKIHKHENTIDEVFHWVATGIHLWKQFKK